MRRPLIAGNWKMNGLGAEGVARAEAVNSRAVASAPGASCNRTCLVTQDFSPIAPDVVEHRFYAPRVGLILVAGSSSPRNDRKASVERSVVGIPSTARVCKPAGRWGRTA